MRAISIFRFLFIVWLCLFLMTGGVVDAKEKKNPPKNKSEQCVDAVWVLVGWSKDFKGSGAAENWTNAAKKKGYSVNHDAGGCSDRKPCVVVYPKDYGSGINKKYGHVAALYGCGSGSCKLQDSNGVCGGYRSDCKKSINFRKAWVIHPK